MLATTLEKVVARRLQVITKVNYASNPMVMGFRLVSAYRATASSASYLSERSSEIGASFACDYGFGSIDRVIPTTHDRPHHSFREGRAVFETPIALAFR